MCRSNFNISCCSKGIAKYFTIVFLLPILGCQQEQMGSDAAEIQETATNSVIGQVLPPTGDFEFYDLEPLPLDDLKVVRYSPEFAERIGMSSENAEEHMPSGLLAIEFSVERYATPSADFYTCHLKVYLDSSLDVWFPGETIVGNSAIVGARHFFQSTRERSMALNEEDRSAIDSKLRAFQRKAYWVTADYTPMEKGARTDLAYHNHYQELMAGVDYASLIIDCSVHRLYQDFQSRPVQVWIEKIGGRDYSQLTDVRQEDFLTFDLPLSFVSDIYSPMVTARARNSELQERRYQ